MTGIDEVSAVMGGQRKKSGSSVAHNLADVYRGRAVWMVAVCVVILLIELALRFTPEGFEHWHYALHRLYYLPIITGGLTFGWTGGLVAAVLSSLSYLSHASDADSPDARNALDRYLETMVFALVGVLAGVLSDRERKQRSKAERAASELREVYQELQRNVEHVKRAARMSALGHLSAGLAHEIRNPLASIEGAASIVLNDDQDQNRRAEFLGIIQEESRRLNRLVSNFLDFARPRQPEMRPTDIGTLIDSVLNLLSQTGNKEVVFRSEVDSDLPQVRCDPEQLKQVLLNLTLNAVQAASTGGEILVSARKSLKGVEILIRDHGSGIRPEHVDSIFDPFFTTKQTGTGLGLPVAYQIIEQHGGELTLRENGPDGACFAIQLPFQGSRD